MLGGERQIFRISSFLEVGVQFIDIQRIASKVVSIHAYEWPTILNHYLFMEWNNCDNGPFVDESI